MADTKISALPASTTPLGGTEVLPIVQSSATKQVSVANLTAGRAISATELTLTTGNLIVASGQGVDFSATSHPAGMTSELLSDYEEGTWTATLATGFATTPTTTGKYTKVGRQVTITCVFSFGVIVTNAAAITITGAPFTAANAVDAVFSGQRVVFNSLNSPFIQLSGTTISFLEVVPSSPTVNALASSSGAGNAPVLGNITITYFV